MVRRTATEKLYRWLEQVKDLPDDQLLELGYALQVDRDEAIRRYNIVAGEVVRRAEDSGATILRDGKAQAEVKYDQSYEWDVDEVRTLASQHVQWEEEKVIPAKWKVRNTMALNNFINKLGDTAVARKLREARRIEKKNPRVTFKQIDLETGEVL